MHRAARQTQESICTCPSTPTLRSREWWQDMLNTIPRSYSWNELSVGQGTACPAALLKGRASLCPPLAGQGQTPVIFCSAPCLKHKFFHIVAKMWSGETPGWICSATRVQCFFPAFCPAPGKGQERPAAHQHQSLDPSQVVLASPCPVELAHGRIEGHAAGQCSSSVPPGQIQAPVVGHLSWDRVWSTISSWT